MLDIEVVKSILNGNKEDYRLLVEKHQQAIFRTCMGYVHDEEDANDLTQETFINAYQKLHKFQFNSSFSTWLYRISINLSLNFIRQKRRNLFDRIENAFESFSSKTNIVISDFPNPEEVLISTEHRSIVQKEIDKLSEKQKTAFILGKYENMSQKEIAGIMKISEGAVESLIQRAKANLQKRLSKYFQKK